MAKPKKYASVVGSLPKMPGIEPERRAVVDAVQKEILTPYEGQRTNISAALKTLDDTSTQIIEEMKHVLKDEPTATRLAHAYSMSRAIRERIDSYSSMMGVLIEAYQWLIEAYQWLMVDAMDAEGVSSIRLASGQPVSTWQEPYAKVEDKEAFRQYCLADPDLAKKLALPWQTTNELCKEMLLKGQAGFDMETGEVTPAPMPPGITMYSQTKVRLGS